MLPNELSEEQQKAIHHSGAPARLLAGPGTGKTHTLTQRAIELIEGRSAAPADILLITFTRAAAHELRERVGLVIEQGEITPRITTLHSYALRQLLRNVNSVESLPIPLRIADDWEERYLIAEDLRDAMRQVGREGIDVGDVKDLFTALSADWETLTADQKNWESEFRDPDFLGAWQAHRHLYGYTLRSELVYQLKVALNLDQNFRIESIPKHLLVDEYQDLNPCDLAVIEWLRERGAELFVAGDDDQSIYGFRNAYPLAIREFIDNSQGAADLRLEVCHRCSREILGLGQFVIGLDQHRVPKTLRPTDASKAGEVRLCSFTNQDDEARQIAAKCAELVAEGIPHNEILLLLRSDRNGAFSKPLRQALEGQGLPVHVDVGGDSVFETTAGRQFLSLIRLAVYRRDSLAWRTLIKLDRNQFGKDALKRVVSAAEGELTTFSDVLFRNLEADLFPRSFCNRLREYVNGVLHDVDVISTALDTQSEPGDDGVQHLIVALDRLEVPERVEKEEDFARARQELSRLAQKSGASDLELLLRDATTVKSDEERVVDPSTINILTMHKAKGLEADTVFIVAAEDQYIPGRVESQAELDDARRLLYVSLTRARQRLYITYCARRGGSQLHTGSTAGTPKRTLTRFLRDSGLQPHSC